MIITLIYVIMRKIKIGDGVMENEKILYKNETIFNKENLQNFSKFVWLQYNKFKYWATIIFSTLFLILGIIGGIGQVIRFQRIPNTFTLIFILIFASIIIVMIKFARGNVKIEEKNKDTLFKFEFSNDYLLISTELASQKILYNDLSNIQNVCNTEKYIYIMINKRAGYIIDKKGFNNYDEQNFTDYLKDKFKDKYIDYLGDTKKRTYTIKDIFICVVVSLIFCGMLLGYIS